MEFEAHYAHYLETCHFLLSLCTYPLQLVYSDTSHSHPGKKNKKPVLIFNIIFTKYAELLK
jgi:hypothetical protein